MISQLEEAAAERIKEKLTAAVSQVDVARGIPAISLPDVQVSIEEGDFSKVASDTFEQKATIYVDIVFRELSSDQLRRKGINLILESIIRSLMLQKLGLKLQQPIYPKNYRNVTTAEDHGEGKITYTLTFTASWNITKLDDEAAEDLLTIGLGYYLNPAAETPTAADTVTLEETL